MQLLLAASLLLSPPAPATRDTVGDLWLQLREVAQRLEQTPAMRAGWASFAAEEGLSEAAWPDYVRVRLAFEATRDGGLWGLRWDITNRAPDSTAVWAQWAKAAVPGPEDAAPVTAIAECDELSALFSLVAWKLGVDKVGLYWPTSNHTIAVWTAATPTGTTRINVPTSQIYLDDDQSLGTDVFDPYSQRNIYPYHRAADVSDDLALPPGLVAWMVQQASKVSQAPAELQRQRNARAREIQHLRGG